MTGRADDLLVLAVSEALTDCTEWGSVDADAFLVRLRELGYEVRRIDGKRED